MVTVSTDGVRATHRLPVIGDDDAGERWCHHCAESWPCTAAMLCDEVDRLRAEISRMGLHSLGCGAGEHDECEAT